MIPYILYLLKVSAGIALISLPYYLLLRKDTSLVLKRFFLIGGLVLSFLLPLAKIQLSPVVSESLPTVFLELNDQAPEAKVPLVTSSESGFHFNMNLFLQIIYLAGVLLLFIRTSYSFYTWFSFKANTVETEDKLHFSDRNEVFSYFRRIHLPNSLNESGEKQSLLLHEKAHIRQLHYVDLLISELAFLLTWFNPFTWLIIRMIKENHEHLADREVLSNGIDPARYRACLLNLSLGVPVFRMGQSFNHSLTKKRFEMMKNLRSKKPGRVKVLILIPFTLIILGLLNVSGAQDGKVTGKVLYGEDNSPLPGVSIIIKGSTVGTVSDLDGSFELEVTGKAELVFSFVGLKTVVMGAKPGDFLKVEMETNVIELDMNAQDLSNEGKGDISVKIKTKSGEEVIYVVDGERVENIDNLDPDDLETVNVLKNHDGIVKKFPDAKEGTSVVIINTKQEEESIEPVFYVVEDMPAFPGGKQGLSDYVRNNLVYPEEAKKQGLEGTVQVQFLVNGQGKVVDAKVTQSSDRIFNKAALSLVNNMPDWTPGKQRGKPVKVQFSLPVEFKLPGN